MSKPFKINKNIQPQTLRAVSSLKVPGKTNLDTAGNSIANTGEIILNKQDNKLYGHNGEEWVELVGGGGEELNPWVPAWRTTFTRGMSSQQEFDELNALTPFVNGFPGLQADPFYLDGGTNKTYRMTVIPSISGPKIILHLAQRSLNYDTNTAILRIDNVSVARHDTAEKIIAGTSVPVTFNGGNTSVDIMPGSDVVSDEILFNAVQNEIIAVSLYISGATGSPSGHPSARQTMYVSEQPGNFTTDVDFELRNPGLPIAPIFSTFWVRGVDVYDPETIGTIAVIGDSVVDGSGASSIAFEIPAILGHLVSPMGYSVINGGNAGNQVSSGGYYNRGDITPVADNIRGFVQAPALVKRIVEEVLALPNVKIVILQGGINDIMWNLFLAPRVIDAYREMVRQIQLNDPLLEIYIVTLTPLGPFGVLNVSGNPLWTQEIEDEKAIINEWIRNDAVNELGIAGILDWDVIIRDPELPIQILPAYKAFDKVHFNDEGNTVVAEYTRDILFPDI